MIRPLSNSAIRIVSVAAALATAVPAVAASHDEFRGSGLTVHYVRLTGHGGNNDIKRRLLQEEHQACFSVHRELGKPAMPLPAEGIPAIPQPEQIEIYYSADTTLTIKKGSLYVINKDNCALTEQPHHIREIRTSSGRCDIDMLKKEAHGNCLDAATIASSTSNGGAWARSPGTFDLSKVPPALRDKVAAQIQQLKASQPRAPEAPTGHNTVASQQCDIFQRASLGYEFCIARPKSSFVIPAAPLNGGIPGLLLQATNPAMTLTAQEVALELELSKNLFAIPADITFTSKPGARHAR